jgi:hypothetical protein
MLGVADPDREDQSSPGPQHATELVERGHRIRPELVVVHRHGAVEGGVGPGQALQRAQSRADAALAHGAPVPAASDLHHELGVVHPVRRAARHPLGQPLEPATRTEAHLEHPVAGLRVQQLDRQGVHRIVVPGHHPAQQATHDASGPAGLAERRGDLGPFSAQRHHGCQIAERHHWCQWARVPPPFRRARPPCAPRSGWARGSA